MKKFFALVLAVAMVLSMSTAFASIGWSQSTGAGAIATKGVSISVKALEFSGTKQDYTIWGLTNATVWKEITGRVVKDTLVKFPVQINVPSAAAAGLNAYDYENETVTVQLTNATIWDIVDANGASVTQFGTVSGAKKASASFNVDPATGKFNEFSAFGGVASFTVLAIVDSTAEINCSVNFKMGQKVYKDGTGMQFGSYTLYWVNGVAMSIVAADGSAIQFGLDVNNKFNSDIQYRSSASIYPLSAGLHKVSYCLNGEIAINGWCGCNNYGNYMTDAQYRAAVQEFNKLMSALGFSFSYGNFNNAYCTEAGIASLIKSVNTTASVKVGACTELGVTATTPSVSIPQTGAVSVIGYALVALAGAALAISKKN